MTDPVAKGLKALKLYSAAEVMEQPIPGWLVEDIIPEGATAMLYGAPGVGKTFVALSIAQAVVSGSKWLGSYRVCPGSVLYIAAEGGGFLRKRLEAVSFPRSGGGFFALEPVYLADPDYREQLLAAVGGIEEPPLRLIVVDTLAMSFTGDENSSREIGDLMRGANIVRERTGAAVLFIHHAVKSSGSRKRRPVERGSSALKGALDTEIALVPFDGSLRLECVKQKDAAPFAPVAISLAPSGHSMIVERGKSFPDDSMSANAVRALRALASEQGGGPLKAGEWREKTGLAESSFFKVRSELLAKGYVEEAYNKKYLTTDSGRLLLDDAPPQKLSA